MMKIYPELMRHKIWCEFSATCDQESTLSVVDEGGSLLILKRIDKAEKGDLVMLDLGGLQPGAYELILEVDKIKHLHKLIVD